MDINIIRSLITVLSLVAFLGIVFWAWSAKRKPAFDEAALLPFADDDVPARQPDAGARP
jgi:cytochrome c oxidase cbb3-type subunit 4